MKSSLLIAAVIFLFAGKVLSDDIFIKAGEHASNKTEINLISSDNAKTEIEVKLNGFYNKKTDANGSRYDNIYLEDFVSLGNPGQAALPTITKLVSIPNYKDVKVRIVSAEFQTFASYDVLPYQTPPLRNTNAVSNVFELDNSYYSQNKDLPEEIVSIKEIAILRDHRIAVVTINPIQYNPATSELKVYTNLKFDLVYEGHSDVNNLVYSTSGHSKSFESIYKQVIFNYQTDNTFTVAPNMVIIVADSLYGSIAPYYEWKNKKGIKTIIKKKSEIAGIPEPTSAQIKDYLTTLYNGPDRPEYVTLVGDARGNNTIGWFSATGGKSDHPYQCVAGTDIFPDLIVSRISVQTKGELDTAVAKLIQYEREPNMAETDWYKRAFVLHSNDGIDPINGQVAKSIFINEGGFTNVDMVSPSASQSQITSYINGGVSWIWFIGHGSETSWASPVWDMSNMVNLNFGKRQPQIVSIACSNADLDYSQTSDCFGEAWIERSRPNSASNIGASTELCAFYTTDTLGREMLYAYFRHGIYDFGSMMNYGKIQAYNFFNGNTTVVETINQFMVLGDATIETYSDVPKPVSVLTSLETPNFKVNIKTAGLNHKGALVAISQNNELKTSGYTDSLGNFAFNSALVAEAVPVNIVVTGKNLLPYEGFMVITSVNNNSKIADSYSLSQNYPNPFNPTTNINFSIPKSSSVSLKVYDMMGKEISTLVNENLSAGVYSYNFNATGLSSGVYFYKLSAGDFSEIRKMTLIK